MDFFIVFCKYMNKVHIIFLQLINNISQYSFFFFRDYCFSHFTVLTIISLWALENQWFEDIFFFLFQLIFGENLMISVKFVIFYQITFSIRLHFFLFFVNFWRKLENQRLEDIFCKTFRSLKFSIQVNAITSNFPTSTVTYIWILAYYFVTYI